MHEARLLRLISTIAPSQFSLHWDRNALAEMVR
ncbi:hypothetical protein ACO22_01516 [Paracoccidioides brasiliensis]|uniref:Uncharacterized protein n=1 Tax=Paracoccidioides brasiliensis TaxID=121759 RepID=A0A1D2JLC8_PARBR|nr:hypothetical protein ACO22_01516 [Paracoccidioides brasiliensis]